ncbi:hypothetical protein BJ944DRAFT_91015 [Cunninghamella echinulata]|nr:hypothetical protein BJ944DRAFT_91015 [Cunninghamella echinulata]
MKSKIEIKWNGRTFYIELEENDFDTWTVQDLKEKCHRITGLSSENIKLLAYGAVMKDKNAPLSHYSIKPGTKLRLIGTNKYVDKPLPPKPESDEQHTLDQLNQIHDKLHRTIIPEISDYENQVKKYNTDTMEEDGALQQKQKLIQKGLYFGEILMQLLFEYDGVVCAQGFDQSRQLRKDGVRISQELLEKVDRIKDSIK